ncbi:MAG: zinc-binding alcohol dehydrogenase family protein [Treponema sp.]|nr:zinc-binding alcohol dehydrogenase family protein [Treponema sp.]
MKALVLEQPGLLTLHDVENPEPKTGEALVKVLAASVCGSDIHSFKGENALLSCPRILGHEVCGVVEEVRSEDGEAVSPGDRVILIPYIGCGHCVACRNGKPNCCRDLSVYGVHHDGAMAEYFTAPLSYLLKVSEDISPESAAVIEPLSISAHAVKRCSPSMGETLLVIGAGPIGLGAAEIARTLGARVVIAETDQSRRDFARDTFGYKHVLNPRDAGFTGELEKLTNGDMPKFLIDSTGNGASMSQAINYLAFGGRMVFVGFYPGKLEIADPDFHRRETELLGSRGATRADFQYVIDCISEKKISPSAFITHRASFEDSKETLEDWVSKAGKVFKGIFTMK